MGAVLGPQTSGATDATRITVMGAAQGRFHAVGKNPFGPACWHVLIQAVDVRQPTAEDDNVRIRPD